MGKTNAIEGVPALGWGRGKECTYVGALEAALAVTDHPCSYTDMMGWSGLAFRTRWFYWENEPAWCPSSAVGEFPEPMAALDKAMGWRQRCEVRLGLAEPHMEELAPQIVASIDRGLPVLAYEHRLNLDVVFGYEDGGDIVLLRDYFKGEEPLRLPASELGPMAIFLDDYGAPLSPPAALSEALRIAIHNWERGTGADHRYWYGDAALEHWSADIGNAESLTDEQREKMFGVSIWCFDTLVDARRAGAAFLQGNGLDKVAARVRAEAEALQAVLDDGSAFLGWWSGKSISDWTPEVRRSEIAVLDEARKCEADWVAELRDVLAKLE